MNHLDSWSGPVGIACEHDVAAHGQRAANGIKGFAAHDDGVACGGALEKREILGQMPWQGARVTDDPVGSHGDNSGEVGLHGEAMGWFPSVQCGWPQRQGKSLA